MLCDFEENVHEASSYKRNDYKNAQNFQKVFCGYNI